MNKSKKLEIYYPSGELDGIRCIKRHFSPLTTYVIPRMLRKDAKQLEGTTRRGIYFLINDNDDNKITQIYVGQTTDGINRLDDHERHKIFWNKAIMFLADNDTFTLNILSGVEAHAIRQARESKNYSVENTVQPRTAKRWTKYSESNRLFCFTVKNTPKNTTFIVYKSSQNTCVLNFIVLYLMR